VSILKKILKTLFWFSFVVSIFFIFWKPSLPSPSSIINILKTSDPSQTEIKKDPYLWQVKGQTYKITPLYDYQITGLVVSDYDSNDWLDYTHKNDPAQTKDLCLIWGTNLQNGIYRELKYKHGEFTCFVNWTSDQVVKFNQLQFSNNHLLPTTEKIAKLIKNSSIGDQVLIKGQLVNYELLDKNGKVKSTRTTSTIRDDRGCEVILVDDFKILKKPAFPYYIIKSYLINILIISTILNISFLFIF
jgi:hypothetical protein